MSPKPKKNAKKRKLARPKRSSRRWRLFWAGFLCFTFSIDGFALFRVFQHWRAYGDVFFDPNTTNFLAILTLFSILILLFEP